MKAVVIERPGGPEVLAVREVPEPSPGHGEVRVRVRATSINRADVMQRMGHYPAPSDSPPDIPGLEYAGEVDALGTGVTGVGVGDRVFGLAGGGTYAECVVVHHRTLAPVPENLTFVEAASIPEVFVTAYDALVSQCGLTSGERLLVHACGSGVGVAALQIARYLGVDVIGTARQQVKLEQARKYGLRHGVLVSDGTFAEAVRTQWPGGADVVLELVGGRYVGEDIACMATKGRLIVVGLVGGLKAEIDLGLVLRNRLTIRGTTLRMRPLEEKIIAGQLLSRRLVPLFAQGRLTPEIHEVFPLAQVQKAHELVDKNENFGKIVLDLS